MFNDVYYKWTSAKAERLQLGGTDTLWVREGQDLLLADKSRNDERFHVRVSKSL